MSALISQQTNKFRFLDNIAITLMLLVPLLLILGRGFADGAMGLTGLLFITRSYLTKDWSWLKTPWFSFILITALYMLIAGIFADYDRKAGIESALFWLRFPLFTIAVATWIIPNNKTQHYLAPSLIILLVLSSIDTIYQFIYGVSITGHHPDPGMPGRLTGPFPARLLIGTFLARLIWPATGLAFAWAFAKEENKKKRLLLSLLFLLLIGFTILISGERAAFGVFVISAFVFAFFAKNLRRILVPLVTGIVILSVLIIGFSPTLRERLINKSLPVIENIQSSPYGAVWHNGYVAWRSAPIMGVGMNNFVPMCEKLGAAAGFRNELPQWKELRCVRHPHNIYLEWAAELGVIGLGLFIGLIFLWIKHIKKHMPDINQTPGLYYAHLGYAVALIIFLWPFMASLSFFSNWSEVLFWWTLGLALSDPKTYQLTDK